MENNKHHESKMLSWQQTMFSQYSHTGKENWCWYRVSYGEDTTRIYRIHIIKRNYPWNYNMFKSREKYLKNKSLAQEF